MKEKGNGSSQEGNSILYAVCALIMNLWYLRYFRIPLLDNNAHSVLNGLIPLMEMPSVFLDITFVLIIIERQFRQFEIKS